MVVGTTCSINSHFYWPGSSSPHASSSAHRHEALLGERPEQTLRLGLHVVNALRCLRHTTTESNWIGGARVGINGFARLTLQGLEIVLLSWHPSLELVLEGAVVRAQHRKAARLHRHQTVDIVIDMANGIADTQRKCIGVHNIDEGGMILGQADQWATVGVEAGFCGGKWSIFGWISAFLAWQAKV